MESNHLRMLLCKFKSKIREFQSAIVTISGAVSQK